MAVEARAAPTLHWEPSSITLAVAAAQPSRCTLTRPGLTWQWLVGVEVALGTCGLLAKTHPGILKGVIQQLMPRARVVSMARASPVVAVVTAGE